ncbi:hypothetical protein ITP53_48080, partial [Nonomuraea sp. K274]|nr:hypothetical protein [Nonomuraea cypriaca]
RHPLKALRPLLPGAPGLRPGSTGLGTAQRPVLLAPPPSGIAGIRPRPVTARPGITRPRSGLLAPVTAATRPPLTSAAPVTVITPRRNPPPGPLTLITARRNPPARTLALITARRNPPARAFVLVAALGGAAVVVTWPSAGVVAGLAARPRPGAVAP